MTFASEAGAAPNELTTALFQGLDNLSRNQVITFRQYSRYVLPLDGYVFWVASGAQNQVKGSLHYGVQKEQEEAETLAMNSVIFSAEAEVQFLNTVNPGSMWIASIDFQASPDGSTGPFLVAFSRQGPFYQAADLFHYAGFAVYPALQSQIVDSPANLLALQPIVSNSLPIWLTQNSFAPVFPSFLVPDNLPPPYIVAHIEPDGTDVLQNFPHYGWPGTIDLGTDVTTSTGSDVTTSSGTLVTTGSGASPLHDLPSYQLARDRVRLTLYGFNNQLAIQYLASLIEYSLNTDAFGFMNCPAIRDDKRFQVEISAIAQKKTIEIVASYYQTTADAIARRLILSAAVTPTVAPFTA
ncbi:hypothetical protein [Acidiphilium sp.]|uniref:hypothetical protein n=1 Tax=Acidiphilium sp. TaxID=527 RepID=UPI003D07A706